MIQLVQPDYSIVGTVGECLDYAHRVFHTPAGIPTAWQAWQNTQYKHGVIEPLPTDVAVVMWYKYIADLGDGVQNYGHVTINQPGTGIYSSPYQGMGHALLHSIAEVEAKYTTHLGGGTQAVVYTGWSEDINGVRIAEGETMDKITKEQEEVLATMQTGSYPGKDYNYQFTGLPLTQGNLDKMLQFWSGQAKPTDAGYIKVSDLYIKG